MPEATHRAGWWDAIARLLAAAAILWPVALVGAAYSPNTSGAGIGRMAVYAVSSRICHQKPERSFQADGHPWPVCARCAGLYLSAPVGAVAALVRRRRRQRGRVGSPSRPLMVWAAVPTVLTVLAEGSGAAPVANLARTLAALPLGMAIAYAVTVAVPAASSNQVD